jgi:hypothetical protein
VGPFGPGKCPIAIYFKAALNGMSNGSALMGRQTMVMRRPKKSVAATICHELGHSMGQTVFVRGGGNPDRRKKPPLGMPDPKDVDDTPIGDYYDDRHGHQGSHCSKGVAKTAPVGTMSNSAGSCIMFGSGRDEEEPTRSDYCEQCQKYIKARRLNYIRKLYNGGPNDGRGPDDY